MTDDLRITVDEVKKRTKDGEDFAWIDTRNPQAWAQSDVMVPEALRVSLDNFDEHLYDIPKNKSIVTYCTWPNEGSSASLAQKLRERGYKNVWALKGGFDAWRNAGLPVASKQEAAWVLRSEKLMFEDRLSRLRKRRDTGSG